MRKYTCKHSLIVDDINFFFYSVQFCQISLDKGRKKPTFSFQPLCFLYQEIKEIYIKRFWIFKISISYMINNCNYWFSRSRSGIVSLLALLNCHRHSLHLVVLFFCHSNWVWFIVSYRKPKVLHGCILLAFLIECFSLT